jgi:RNA polymerase sigma-70 factor (ECF subfamily)
MKSLLERAIASLPDKEREVYELRDIQEVSGEETAVRLKISQAAMKSRLFRARTNLRRYLDEALIPTNPPAR